VFASVLFYSIIFSVLSFKFLLHLTSWHESVGLAHDFEIARYDT